MTLYPSVTPVSLLVILALNKIQLYRKPAVEDFQEMSACLIQLTLTSPLPPSPRHILVDALKNRLCPMVFVSLP